MGAWSSSELGFQNARFLTDHTDGTENLLLWSNFNTARLLDKESIIRIIN